MKLSLVLSFVTAIVGFGLGWLLKPAAELAIPKPPPAAKPFPLATAEPSPAAIPQPEAPAARPAPAEHVRPAAAPGKAAAAAESREKIAEAKNAAKMLRFAEAVGLSKAQQADLATLIAESQKVATPGGQSGQPAGANDVLDQLAASAAALEKGLATLLTPEQATAFDALRNRERDNRVETNAQRELGDLTEVTDLSTEQRDKVLAQLRKASAGELAAMPSPLALVLDSSVLPLGPLAPSAQAIQTLRQLADGQAPEDPAALHAKLIDSQRRQLDARLALLKDILTPAQLAQYQATVAEQFAIHDLMSPSHW